MLEVPSARGQLPPGATIKVEPIRMVNAINRIKPQLESSPRNLALFVLGINVAFRAGELFKNYSENARLSLGDFTPWNDTTE